MEFGKIRTYFEKTLTESYKTEKFKHNMDLFNKNILSNKDICEIYESYNLLSTPQGMEEDIADEYLDEMTKAIKSKLEKNSELINNIVSELDDVLEDNKYQDIDNIVYSESLDSIKDKLISKNKIKNTILSEINLKENHDEKNLPLNMVDKIFKNTLKEYFDNLPEKDLEEIIALKKLDKEQLTETISDYKESIKNKLSSNLNEGVNDEIIDKVLNKVNDSEDTIIDLYKLKKLYNDL